MNLICFLFFMSFTCHCLAENVYRSPLEERAIDSSCNAIMNTTSQKLDGIFGKIDKQEENLVEEIRTVDRNINTKIDAIGHRLQKFGAKDPTQNLSQKMDQILDALDEKEENIVDTIQSSDKRVLRKVAIVRAMIEELLVKENTRSCLDLKKRGVDKSGVYETTINGTRKQVYCDMETDEGGWLVFQRRKDGSVDFYRDWESYKTGFGDPTGEFWLGNENLYQILLDPMHEYELRVDLEDFEGEKRFAKYSTFSITSEDDNYRLSVGAYTGNAGNGMIYQNEQQFTTKDRDNDVKVDANCAKIYKGAWWYEGCHASNLNGLYLHGPSTYHDGVEWLVWKVVPYSLKFSEMKIRPKY